MRQSIKKPAVLFDLGNTLVAYYRPEAFRPILALAIGSVFDELTRRGLTDTSYSSALRLAEAEDREAEDFHFIPLEERLARIFNVSLLSDAPLAEKISSLFLRPIFDIGVVYDDVLPVLDHLRRVGYPVAIVSNAPWGSSAHHWRKEVARLGLGQAVDEVVFCGDVGWRKPARQIFEHAARKVARSCSECIFVGDDLRWDVGGSESAGMRSILLDREARYPDYKGERIDALTELLPEL